MTSYRTAKPGELDVDALVQENEQLHSELGDLYDELRRRIALTQRRPPRERYVRSSRPTIGGAVVEPGVELRDGDDFRAMSEELWTMLFACDPGEEHDPEKIALPLESAITRRWPIAPTSSMSTIPKGGWLQIFQPYGVPRNP